MLFTLFEKLCLQSMCSELLKRMENSYEGDLTDIVRARGSSTTEWQPFPSNNPINYPSDPVDDFGDPFTQFRDPLLHDIIDSTTPVSSGLFQNSRGVENINATSAVDRGSSIINQLGQHKINVVDVKEMRSSKPSSIFSRMLQISPKLQVPPRDVTNDHHALVSPNSSKVCLPESPGVQISSPRNTGIKRRKSQGKKVVYIPAPAPVNSSSSSTTRPSGEVVPSDLWAWRKYGQKPIKGSPYPRGYYRCSSSKGCLARKQVERSRTDPNMLVITYTSEHNHPWPTQRNALAGSTRSHHPTSKINTNTKDSSNPQKQTINPPHKQDHNKETSIENPANTAADHVKKESMDQDFDNNVVEFDEGVSHSYKPSFLESCEDSFFAELGEIEADPLDLLFPLGGGCDDNDDEENNINKALDPFSFYDWPGKTSQGDL